MKSLVWDHKPVDIIYKEDIDLHNDFIILKTSDEEWAIVTDKGKLVGIFDGGYIISAWDFGDLSEDDVMESYVTRDIVEYRNKVIEILQLLNRSITTL